MKKCRPEYVLGGMKLQMGLNQKNVVQCLTGKNGLYEYKLSDS